MKRKLLLGALILAYVIAGWRVVLADNANVVNPVSRPVPVVIVGNVVTVASLPGSPSIGQTATVTDGTAALAWGATVTGGGTTKYLVFYNGTNWTVAGK